MLKVHEAGLGSASSISSRPWERHAKIKALIHTLGPPKIVEQDGDSGSDGEKEEVDGEPASNKSLPRSVPPPPTLKPPACLNPGQQRRISVHKEPAGFSRRSSCNSDSVQQPRGSVNPEFTGPKQIGHSQVREGSMHSHLADKDCGTATSGAKENRPPSPPPPLYVPQHTTPAISSSAPPTDAPAQTRQLPAPYPPNPPTGNAPFSSSLSSARVLSNLSQNCSQHTLESAGHLTRNHGNIPASTYPSYIHADRGDVSRTLGAESETSEIRSQGLNSSLTFPESRTSLLQGQGRRTHHPTTGDTSQRGTATKLSALEPGSTQLPPSSTSKSFPAGKPPLDPSSSRKSVPSCAVVPTLSLASREQEHDVVVMRSHGTEIRLKKLAVVGRGGSSKVSRAGGFVSMH